MQMFVFFKNEGTYIRQNFHGTILLIMLKAVLGKIYWYAGLFRNTNGIDRVLIALQKTVKNTCGRLELFTSTGIFDSVCASVYLDWGQWIITMQNDFQKQIWKKNRTFQMLTLCIRETFTNGEDPGEMPHNAAFHQVYTVYYD